MELMELTSDLLQVLSQILRILRFLAGDYPCCSPCCVPLFEFAKKEGGEIPPNEIREFCFPRRESRDRWKSFEIVQKLLVIDSRAIDFAHSLFSFLSGTECSSLQLFLERSLLA